MPSNTSLCIPHHAAGIANKIKMFDIIEERSRVELPMRNTPASLPANVHLPATAPVFGATRRIRGAAEWAVHRHSACGASPRLGKEAPHLALRQPA